MNKKYLLALPIAEACENDKNKEQITAELCPTDKDDVLVITVFDESRNYTHRIFIDKKGFFTTDKDGKQSAQTLAFIKHQERGFSYIYADDYYVSKQNEQVIFDFLDKAGHERYGQSAVQCIQNFLSNFTAEKRQRAVNRQAEIMESFFSQLPDLPPDMDTWVQDEILDHSRYIFLQPKSQKKAHRIGGIYRTGYCTSCKTDVAVSDDVHHNEEYQCPECGCYAIAKSVNLSRSKLKDEAKFYIIQRAGDNIAVRFFTALRDYSVHTQYFSTEYQEYMRYIFTSKKAYQYKQAWEYERYGYRRHSDDKYPRGWVRRKNFYSAIYDDTTIYGHNINDVFKGGQFMYSAAATALENGIDIIRYLAAYTWCAALEYLLKAGFTRIVEQIIRLNSSGQKQYKVWLNVPLFGLSKQDFNMVVRFKNSLGAVEILRLIRAKGYKLDETIWEQFTDLDVITDGINRTKTMLEFCSPQQILNYLEKQSAGRINGKTDILIDWSDYLNECRQLGYDLSEQSINRPKNLLEMHARTGELLEIKKDPLTNEKIKRRAKSLKKQFEFNSELYTIVVPKSLADIVNEGKIQNHCVGGYAKSHAAGSTTILFIRRQSNPFVPFYTVEWRDDKIQQCRGHGNQDCHERPQVDAFIAAWLTQMNAKQQKAG